MLLHTPPEVTDRFTERASRDNRGAARAQQAHKRRGYTLDERRMYAGRRRIRQLSRPSTCGTGGANGSVTPTPARLRNRKEPHTVRKWTVGAGHTCHMYKTRQCTSQALKPYLRGTLRTEGNRDWTACHFGRHPPPQLDPGMPVSLHLAHPAALCHTRRWTLT
jgi:hypothetical protein